MKIQNVLVTGASGKIGRRLIPALVDAGYKVRAVQFQTPVRYPGVQTVKGAVGDRAFVRRALKDIDAVCHLATSKEDPDGFIDVAVRGTFNLADEGRQSKRLKQIVYAGGDCSVGIFFYPQPIPLDENAPVRAYPGYYAFSKVMEETILDQSRMQYGLPVTNLRFSWIQDQDDILAYMTLAEPNFGGPPWKDLASTKAQKACFRRGRDGVGCLVHPDGKPYVRHLVGIDDVVQAFLLALGNPAAVGQTFHIAAPAPFSYDVLSATIGEKLRLPVVDFTFDGAYDFAINISKARSVLGYEPQFDVFRMVDAAIAFRESGGERAAVKYMG